MLVLIMALLGVAHAAGSAAQSPLPAVVATQPMFHTTAQGCGLRLFAAHVAANQRIVAVEASVNVYADGTATFSGGVFEFAPPSPGRPANPEPIAIDDVWVKAPDMGKTMPVLDKVDKGAGGYSLHYAVNADSAIAVMLSAMKEESILFGFRRAARPDEPVFIGAPKLARGEAEQLQRCIANLTR